MYNFKAGDSVDIINGPYSGEKATVIKDQTISSVYILFEGINYKCYFDASYLKLRSPNNSTIVFDYDFLIDLALITKDECWFNELSIKKNSYQQI